MSSFDRRTFLIALAALAGCGFQPVYGPGGAGVALQGRVLVDEPADREGFLLVRTLEERLGRAAAPAFGLSATLATRTEGLAITPAGVTTRYNLVGLATYALRDLDTGEIVFAGETENFTGYSTTGSTVETLAAERDARERLMTILANQIVTRLYALDLPTP